MIVKGFQKVSLIDYPGKVAAVVFVGGCNFRCPYCYNRDLVLCPERLPTIPEEEVLAYLEKRKGLVEGVVITGGEPTLQKDLLEFVDRFLRPQFFVKLDTNGANTSALCSAVVNGLVDYVALDIKAPLDERYEMVSRCPAFAKASAGRQCVDVSKIRESIGALLDSGVDFELRTTVVPTLHSEKDLLDLAKQLSEIAPEAKWFLQNFQPKNCLDPEFEKIKPYDNIFLENLLRKLRAYVPGVELR